MMPRTTALLIAVPEAEAIYEHWNGDRGRVGVPGLPLHVTILFPFMPDTAIDSRVERALDELASSRPPFDYTLTHLNRFPAVLYVAPWPATPFTELTEAVVAKWPAYRPYEGAYEQTVPHVTLAEGAEPDGLSASAEAALPIRAVARELLLMAVGHDGVWHPVRRFPLGGG
jgi:2'-5' RNA ligase